MGGNLQVKLNRTTRMPMIWLLAAILISFPIRYLISENWLENFVYRINLEWWSFAGAGLSVLWTALFTVIGQPIKAAHVNPSESLRNE